ncbi:hypothetical protein ACRASS_18485 [Bacteroides hominis]|uniref:hypothetical protein n=1 Tax=Bacteroides hominis TaxID=2763023 RepID=UPI003D6BF45F
MDMASWMSVKSISDKYGISESRVLGWIRECEITSSTVGSVVLIDDESVQNLIGNEKRLARLTTNYEQLCGKLERRIEAELKKDEDAALKMRLFDDFAPIVRRILSMVVGGLSTEEQKMFNSAFAASPLSKVANRMGFNSVCEYLKEFKKMLRNLPESTNEVINGLQSELSRSRKNVEWFKKKQTEEWQMIEAARRRNTDLWNRNESLSKQNRCLEKEKDELSNRLRTLEEVLGGRERIKLAESENGEDVVSSGETPAEISEVPTDLRDQRSEAGKLQCRKSKLYDRIISLREEVKKNEWEVRLLENHLKTVHSWDYAVIILEVWIKRNFEKKVKISIQEVLTEAEIGAATTTLEEPGAVSVEEKKEEGGFWHKLRFRFGH